MTRILLIEDEEKTARFIKKGLEENQYSVDLAFDGKEGLDLAMQKSYDLVISDIRLPGMDGHAICRELRKKKSDLLILMLSALSSTDDVVTGFDLGADDYLVKPFEFRELLVRIRALLKRGGAITNQNILTVGNLALDVQTRRVVREGKEVTLTAKEGALLEYLMRNKGRVIPRSELAKNVWNIDFDTGTNMIEVYVNYLRNKMDKGFEKKMIHNQFGTGYILKEE
jgi:two-component system, OmpR family, copper resistance phosphate regulon response regulator CusR